MADTATAVPSAPPDPKSANQARFEEDLEFLMSLANPHCVHELALKGTLSLPTMQNYLSYLGYFHRPEYALFVRYPISLAVLDLLVTSPTFVTEMGKPEVAHLWGRRLLAGWTYAGRRRIGDEEAGTGEGGKKEVNGAGKSVVEGLAGTEMEVD